MTDNRYVLLRIDIEYIGRFSVEEMSQFDFVNRISYPLNVNIDDIEMYPPDTFQTVNGGKLHFDPLNDVVSMQKYSTGGTAGSDKTAVWQTTYTGIAGYLDPSEYQQEFFDLTQNLPTKIWYTDPIFNIDYIYYDYTYYLARVSTLTELLFTESADTRDLNALDPTEFNGSVATNALGGNDVVRLPDTLAKWEPWGVFGVPTFLAGEGDDSVLGRRLDDIVHGEAGNDRLSGGAGNDTLDGGNDNDRLEGGADDDLLVGGAAPDVLYGGMGNDRFWGGGGDDTVSIAPGEDRDIIAGGETDGESRDKDTVYLTGRPTDYAISWSGDNVTLARLADREDRITLRADVESLHFEGLGSNQVVLKNTYLELARLADVAYRDTPDTRWRPMVAQELGLPSLGSEADYGIDFEFTQGIYRAAGPLGTTDAAVAHIYNGIVNGKTTLTVAFRGTDFNGRVVDDLVDEFIGLIDWHYARFAPLIEAIQTYIQDNGVQQIYVTGHSLGGAIAQLFLQEDGIRGVTRFEGVTFGSPGALRSESDSRLVNFIHTHDLVGQIADLPLFERAGETILVH